MRYRRGLLDAALVICLLSWLSAAGCRLEDASPKHLVAPGTPAGFTIAGETEASIALSWEPAARATSYQVFRDVSAASPAGTLIYDGDQTSALDSGVEPDAVVYYRLRAGNSAGYSGLSPSLSARTVCPRVSHRPETGSFRLDLNLGHSTCDLYFIFTNPAPGAASSQPVVSALTSQPPSPAVARELPGGPSPGGQNEGLRGKPEIDDFNRQPPPLLRSAAAPKALLPGQPRALSDAAGDAQVFKYDGSSPSIPATCRLVLPGVGVAGGNPRTLSVWVADECWVAGGSPAVPRKVDQALVDQLGAKFLLAGLDNDIYDWVANIFGPEWGTTPYSNLIAPDDSLTILLYDIDADRSTNGGVIGLFWAKDNFLNVASDPVLKYSNERVMFYLDAVLYAAQEGPTWEITDNWPRNLISALAHELQHMIGFYQKVVLQTGETGLDTWINEMLSLATEDCVAWSLQVPGPRGVAYDDGTGGPANNTSGRLPIFNANNFVSLTNWLQNPQSYSACYAYGAYLLRNFGGVQVLHDIVHNPATDYQSIEYALAQGGYSETFSDLLGRWGAAGILSDDPLAPAGYRYNSGQFFTCARNSATYRLGSINLFNYRYNTLVGPLSYAGTTVGSANPFGTSNLYYIAGRGLSGLQSWDIQLPAGMGMTVVRK